MNAQKKLPNASFEEKSCWFECRWPLARTAPCAWRRLPATTEGTETCGGKTPAASGGRNLRKTGPPPLKTVTWMRDSPFFFPPTSFSYDLGFKGNCCGCDPCPGMRSWTLLKGLNKGTSVLELCGSPAMGDSIELETVRTNGSHRDADLSEVRVSGRVQQLIIVRYCTWNWVFAVPCRT